MHPANSINKCPLLAFRTNAQASQIINFTTGGDGNTVYVHRCQQIIKAPLSRFHVT